VTVLRSFWLWAAAFAVVVAVAITVTPSASSQSTRIAHLESLVKCPSCQDLSVAESNATTAVAVRREITADVRRGESDNAILTSIEDAYGASILLSPSTSGLGVLLWVVPLGVVLVVVLVGVRLVRRRR
jgi:cytochrome c-type biogenesis protein CcmH/NrfF